MEPLMTLIEVTKKGVCGKLTELPRSHFGGLIADNLWVMVCVAILPIGEEQSNFRSFLQVN